MPTPPEAIGGWFALGVSCSLGVSWLARPRGLRSEGWTLAVSLTYLLPLALSFLPHAGTVTLGRFVLVRHVVPLLFAPGLYLWLLARTESRPKAIWLAHLVPFAVGALTIGWGIPPAPRHLPLVLVTSALGGLLSALSYAWASRRVLSRWKSQIESRSSFVDRSASLAYTNELFVGLFVLQAYVFAAGVAAWIKWRTPWLNPVLVLQGAPALFAVYFTSRAFQRNQHGTSTPEASVKASYAKSGLDEGRLSHFRSKLETWMDREEAFRDFDLSLADVSRGTGIARHAVSQTLNAVLGQSFYEWVNAQRASWVKRALDAHDERSLSELSILAGFRSRSSFGTHFRKLTGTTPTDYRRRAHTVLADRAGRF